MSKVAKQWYDWTPPPAAKDEGEAVRKVVAEITRSIAGYEPPPPISLEDQKDLPKSARRREKQREVEHRARIEALERAEKQLREDHKRLAALAAEQVEEQRRLKQKQRDRESAERSQQNRAALQATLADGRRRMAAADAARVQTARHAQQQRDAYAQGLQEIIDGWNRANNPPAPAATEIVYIEKEDEPGAGALPRLPTWR